MLSRRTVFSICCRLVGHFPVWGWLQVAAGVIKRRVRATTKGSDERIDDAPFREMLTETIDRAQQADPCRGEWCVNSKELDVWADVSSFAPGVLIELCGTVIEDACWLRPESDTQHINIAELHAIIKRVNLAVHWNAKLLHLKTDSLCVNRWLTNMLTHKAKLDTKVASEMLIWRRLNIFPELIRTYALMVDVTLVNSN